MNMKLIGCLMMLLWISLVIGLMYECILCGMMELACSYLGIYLPDVFFPLYTYVDAKNTYCQDSAN